MKNSGMVILLIGIALLLIETNSSWSQPPPSNSREVEVWFNPIDANGDGKISRDENIKYTQERAEKSFTLMDVNNDGFVTKDEFKQGASKTEKRGKRKATEQKMKEKKQ